MAGDSDTLRDVLSGFNTMQMRMGLTPGSSSAMGMPMMPPPQVKHPGEISVEAMARFSGGGMGFTPGGAGGSYAAQFGQGMQRIQSGYVNPFVAQQMSQQSGGQGFSMLPDPVSMTAPSMGVFRPGFSPPPPMGLARSQPIIRMPFAPQFPTPMFQSPMAMERQQAELGDSQNFAGMMAGIPTAARVGTGIAGAGLGMLTGAHLMKQFGPRMQGFGRLGGLVGGAALGFGAIGSGMESLAEMGTQPITSRRAFGEQFQNISRNFVVGGPDLDESGRGMSLKSSLGVTNQLRKDVGRGATGGFNMRDMMSITSQAADTGMMDMAQSGEQIIAQARNIARGLSSFMKLANEPDIRKAMQQMGQMRQMGLTIPETNNAMQQAQTFARMAGTTVSALGESAGMPGAMTFQGLGMSAGLGYQVGMASGGLARQGVASGALSTSQLAMAGGVRGLQQTLTETAGAGLGVDFPMLAMLKRGEGGKFSVDPDMARRIAGGEFSLGEQASMAGANMKKFGSEGISAMSTQMNELRDQLGRTMGPQGSIMMTIRQAMNLQKELGGKDVVTMGAALRGLGLNEQQARPIELLAQNQEFWTNTMTQMKVATQDARDQERTRRDQLREGSSLTSQIGRGLERINPLRGTLQGFANAGSNIADAASEFFSDRNRADRADERGGIYVPRSRTLRFENAESQKRADAFMIGKGADKYTKGIGLRPGGGGVTGSEMVSAGINLAGDILGVGIPSMLGLKSNAPRESQGVADIATMGGFHGKLAEMAPSFMALAGGITSQKEMARIHADAVDAAALSDTINAGVTMESGTAVRISKQQEKVFQAYGRLAGKDVSKLDPLRVATDAALEVFSDSASWTGDAAATETAVKNRVKKNLIAKGMPESAANQYVEKEWKSGLGAQVMRMAEREASPEAAAAIAKTRDARGVQMRVTGKNLKDMQGQVEKEQDKIQKAAGMGGGLFEALTGTGKKQFGIFKEMAGANSSTDLMMMQAAAMRAAGDTEGAAKLEGQVQQQDPEGFSSARERVADKMSKMTKDQKEALVTSGQTAQNQKDPKGFIEDLQKHLNATAGAEPMLRGAAAMAEKGVGALSSLTSLSTADVGTAMDKISGDETQLAALANISPEAAKAVRAKAGAKTQEEKDKATESFQKAMQIAGKVKDEELGGKGAGGKEETAIDKAVGDVSSFAASLPTFVSASETLLSAATSLQDTQKLIAQQAKLPGF
jgi:hypothetical protein